MNFREELGKTKLRRIVVKLGSTGVTKVDGLPDKRRIKTIVDDIVTLRNSGIEVILVCSGAINAGRGILGFDNLDKKEATDISMLQALSAVGQPVLLKNFIDQFRKHSSHCAQVLLTHDDFKNRKRYFNARNTISTLLSQGIIPILNENDSVSFEEITVGDNDHLAAMVTEMMEVDLTVILTSTDGLYDKNPEIKGAKKIDSVSYLQLKEQRKHFLRDLKLSGKSDAGRGGMRSKLEAIKNIIDLHASAIIGSFKYTNPLLRLIKENQGTFFFPLQRENRKIGSKEAKKRWLKSTAKGNAYIKVDHGAKEALQRSASLLSSGIVEVQGSFKRGDAITVLCGRSKVAFGIVEYDSAEVRKIGGFKTSEIEDVLGYCTSQEVIHRNNMVLNK